MTSSCCCTPLSQIKLEETKQVKKKKFRILKDTGSLRVGGSINIADINHASLDGCKCFQIYLGSRVSYSTPLIKNKKRLKEDLEKKNRTLYVHCPLTVSLAHQENDKRFKSYQAITGRLVEIQDMPMSAVFHIGKRGPLNNVYDCLNSMSNEGYLKPTHNKISYPLLAEVAAGQGTELGKDWEEIRKLFEGLDQTKIGLCLDTQHLFASGMCTFEDSESVVKLFDQAEGITGRKVSLIHLNDSKVQGGKNVDRHASVGRGHIWYKDQSSFNELIYRCYDDNIDVVSETDDCFNDFVYINKLNLGVI